MFLAYGGRLRNRQYDSELCSTIGARWWTDHVDDTSVRRDDLLDDGQTQPAAAGQTAARVVGAVEAVEDVGQVCACDALTGVGDATSGRSILQPSGQP